jgi:hypothetical protein
MHLKPSKANMILIAGLIGIIGALITVISDLILIGRPTNAYSFFKNGTESMAGLAEWRITIGTFLGVIALPFQIGGLTVVYFGLKPAGKLISFIVVAIAVHALLMGVAFHASYAFIGSGWKVYHETGLNNINVAELINKFDFYWKIIFTTMFTELTLSSIGFVLIILTRKTLFPKWMAILNPLCVYLFMFPLIFVIPAPIGGFIASAYLNLSTIVFFIFCTTVIYKKMLLYNL